MGNLAKVLGGPWTPPAQVAPKSPQDQLISAMLDAGIDPPDGPIEYGRFVRFDSSGKGSKTKKDGWYIVFDGPVPAGQFGCWRQGLTCNFRAEVNRTLSVADEMALARQIAQAQEERKRQQAQLQESVGDVVARIWEDGAAASPDHPYLKRKQVQPHGLRITGDGRLMVPMLSPDGELTSLQYIGADGDKKYHPGASVSGCFGVIGAASDRVLIAEGFATAATLHEVTGKQAYIAFSASNIPKVAAHLRENLGSAARIVVVADHDEHGVGRNYADQAAQSYGASVVMPPAVGQDANDYHLAGGDLNELIEPKQDQAWLVSADDFSSQPAPIQWLIKHWIQRDALIMVHGPSGAGKSFAVLDWCLHIASEKAEWRGNKVRNGAVVYLAGEGHHGLRARLAAWKHHNRVTSTQMWVSRTGCDLNTQEGYTQAAQAIRMIETPPVTIVVDTLHRFMHGDENSAQDAKTMIDACAGLMREFQCTVILVHHTGVSEEAQHRARGSSAWKGALDVEISVVPAKEKGGTLEIVQRKIKEGELADPLGGVLTSVAIPGWLDEDGEQVTSAVIEPADIAPKQEKQDSKIQTEIQRFRKAWFASGAEKRDGLPYISRSGLIDYLVNNEGIKESSASMYVKPAANGKLIYNLLAAEIINPFEHGWTVTANQTASAFLLAISD